VEKTNFTNFGPPLEKFWKDPLVAPHQRAKSKKKKANPCAKTRIIYYDIKIKLYFIGLHIIA